MVLEKIREQRGEFVLDRSFGLLLGAAALVFAVSVLGVVFQGNKLTVIANDLTRMIELAGEVSDTEVDTRLNSLCSAAGLEDVTVQVDASHLLDGKRIQFGTDFTVSLSYTAYFGIGGVLRVPIPLNSSVVGRSERYWKP